MGRPKEPLIDPVHVVEEALSMIDQEGLVGLSMRGLGKRLGVNPASLYHHFHNKEDILEAVREHIVRKAKPPRNMAKKPWEQQLMILGKLYRSISILHPNAGYLVAASNPSRVRTMSYPLYEGVFNAMLEDGLDGSDAIYLMTGIETLAIGSVIEEFSMGSNIRFADVDQVRFPSLHRATRGKALNVKASFPQMLSAFIEGAKAQMLASKASAPKARRSVADGKSIRAAA